MIGKRRMQAEPIPFVVGDKVEERSFEDGYRGAWFRAQLEEIDFREGEAWCRLRLLDYEQDEDYWMKLYQEVPGTVGCKREMMLRPEFPPLVRHNEYAIPAGSPGNLVAMVKDEWRVGDVVDWNESDCYWESEIVKVISKNKVKVTCPHYPGTWTLGTRLLRPALTWSVDHGWSVPQQNDRSVELVKLEQHNQQQLKKRKCRKLSTMPKSPPLQKVEEQEMCLNWVSRRIVRRAKSTLLARAEDTDDATAADIYAALREWDLCFQEVHQRLHTIARFL